MYRPGFGVVSTVVTVLCVVAAFALVTAPRIAPRAANSFRTAHDDFLREAQFEGIEWYAFGPETLVAARRLNRPILLVIGSPTSHARATLDTLTFTDTEVEEYLNRKFVCARIDGAIYPEWMNAMLPVTRLSDPFRTDVQIWALDESGQAFDGIPRVDGSEDMSPHAILPILVDMRHEFDRHQPIERPPYLFQAQDIRVLVREAELERSVALSPRVSNAQVRNSFALYSAVIRSVGQRNTLGFPIKQWVGLSPQVWRYLVLTGDRQTLRHAVIDGVLRSPMIDLMDGGFFHTLELGEPTKVEFEKQTVENADAMLALAEYAAWTHDSTVHRVAQEIWRYLVQCSGGPAGFVQGQLGDEGDRGRSRRYSISARRLRETLPPDLREWAVANLGLDVVDQPQAVPYPAEDVLLDPRLTLIMDAFRQNAPLLPPTVDAGDADISFTTTARALQVARIWGSRERIARALSWLAPLQTLRSGNDVLRRVGDRAEGKGYLGDYLAYSDAHLEAFLATGQADELELGWSALHRARNLFATLTPGVWVLNQPVEPMLIPNAVAPEIADNLHESCTARAIRLLWAYGRLLGDTLEGRECMKEARTITQTMRLVALSGGPLTAGFFCAAAELIDPTFAIAVGPHAAAEADALDRLAPTRLIAPAIGLVREDLQTRASGIYVIGEKVDGPLTVDEAARRLSPVFAVGPRLQMPTLPPAHRP